MATATRAKKKKAAPKSGDLFGARAAKLARELLRARDAGKEAYARADALMAELRGVVKVGQAVEIGGGQVATVVDQYADRDVVWKPTGVRRYEIKVSRAADLTGKL